MAGGVVGAFAAIYLIWGSTYLAIAQTVQSVPPIFMVAVRGAIAGGLLYAWARGRGASAVTGSEMLNMAPTAGLLFGGGYVLVGWAEQFVPSGPAALLGATTPAWVVLIEWLGGKRARPSRRFLVALFSGIVGVGVLVGGDAGQSISILPALALVGSSVAWALGTVRARQHAAGDPVRDAAVQLLTGCCLLLPVSVAVGEGPAIMAGFTTDSLLALAYLIVFGSLAGYYAYVWLLHHVPASKVASHSYVNPVIAVLVGGLLAHERVGWNTVVAAALIIVSVAAIVTERNAPAHARVRPNTPGLARWRRRSGFRPGSVFLG